MMGYGLDSFEIRIITDISDSPDCLVGLGVNVSTNLKDVGLILGTSAILNVC